MLQLLDDVYKAGNADTQSHAVLSFEVKSKRSLVKLRHQIKRDKAFCYPGCHKGLTAGSPQRPPPPGVKRPEDQPSPVATPTLQLKTPDPDILVTVCGLH